MASSLVLLSGNSNKPLVKEISASLGVPISPALVSQYSDGETRVEIQTNIRGSHVFIVQPTSFPANHHIMEALILVDACRRASARTITLVLPYFGYARQERKGASRTPITAKLVADLFEAAGADRLLTLELHNSAIQGFFHIPVDHLFAKPVFVQYFKANPLENLVVVSPDAGGVERARALAKLLNCGLVVIDKRRDRPNESAVMNIIGDVAGKACLIVDDIVDTGGSLLNGVNALLAHGAKEVYAAITHPVLSSKALERIEASALKKLLVTNSIDHSSRLENCSKIEQVSIAPLLAAAITRIHTQDSISSLFAP